MRKRKRLRGTTRFKRMRKVEKEIEETEEHVEERV